MTFDADRRMSGDLAVLDLRGDVDGQADEALNAAYEGAIVTDPKRVLLNFNEVSYINSTGIALIVGLLAEARRSGRKILACGLTDHYKDIFDITRISDHIQIVDDETAAQAAGTSA